VYNTTVIPDSDIILVPPLTDLEVVVLKEQLVDLILISSNAKPGEQNNEKLLTVRPQDLVLTIGDAVNSTMLQGREQTLPATIYQ
jgi:hypothetical protein